GDGIAMLLNSPELPTIYGALLISLAFGGLLQIGQTWALRELRYRPLAASRVAQAVASAAGQVALVLAGQGAVGLTLGDAAGKAVGVGVLAQPFRRLVDRGPGWLDVRRAAVRYRRFPLYS